MLLRLIRFFRGWVRFKVIGRFPERFINLAIKNGIGIFNAEPVDGILFAGAVVSDYRLSRQIAKRAGVRLRITERHGLPFLLARYRNRSGLAIGAVVFIILSLVLQNFVWTVEINGVETLSETQLLNSIEDAGFSVGKFKGSLDLHKIERKVLLEYSEIGWMSINLIGTHAQIEIKEKALVPKLEYSSDYCNIKSKADGIILSTNVRRGTKEVQSGSAVSKGQLLVSGFYENALGEIRFVDADAEIIAQTKHSFTSTCNDTEVYYAPDKLSKRSSVSLLWLDFPITFSPEKAPFTSIVTTRQVFLDDKPVPLSLSTQQSLSYTKNTINHTEETAQKVLNADLALYKLFELQNAQSISEETNISKTKEGYCLSSQLLCTEDIGIKENLIVNDE